MILTLVSVQLTILLLKSHLKMIVSITFVLNPDIEFDTKVLEKLLSIWILMSMLEI